LVATTSTQVCSVVAPGGVWGQSKVWYRKAWRGLLIPLPEHAGHSLLRDSKSRSRTLDDGSAVKVVHRLGRWVWHCSVARRCITCVGIDLSKINSTRRRRRRRINIKVIMFFSVLLFYENTQYFVSVLGLHL
jgi:hypothetical protein